MDLLLESVRKVLRFRRDLDDIQPGLVPLDFAILAEPLSYRFKLDPASIVDWVSVMEGFHDRLYEIPESYMTRWNVRSTRGSQRPFESDIVRIASTLPRSLLVQLFHTTRIRTMDGQVFALENFYKDLCNVPESAVPFAVSAQLPQWDVLRRTRMLVKIGCVRAQLHFIQPQPPIHIIRLFNGRFVLNHEAVLRENYERVGRLNK